GRTRVATSIVRRWATFCKAVFIPIGMRRVSWVGRSSHWADLWISSISETPASNRAPISYVSAHWIISSSVASGGRGGIGFLRFMRVSSGSVVYALLSCEQYGTPANGRRVTHGTKHGDSLLKGFVQAVRKC